jgi:hypothetical protein
MTQTTHDVSVGMTQLEMARGHDGLLRGGPEPVIVVGVYMFDGVSVRMLGRTVQRFVAGHAFPTTLEPEPAQYIRRQIQFDGSLRFLVLVLAVEEDGGKDVGRLYGMLERHHQLALWPKDGSDLNPRDLTSLAQDEDVWTEPTPVHVLDDGRTVGPLESDDWVGACLFLVDGANEDRSSLYRAHLLSRDRRNDWTAMVEVHQAVT